VSLDPLHEQIARTAFALPEAGQVAHDARIREAVQLSFGRVLHPDEVAPDKTLALFGRAAARDLVDVAALSERYPLELNVADMSAANAVRSFGGTHTATIGGSWLTQLAATI
jgi:hypothetical protein